MILMTLKLERDTILQIIRVMDDKGVINELGGKYQGLDRYEARKANG